MLPELQAANSLLKRGVRYKLPAPLLFRLLGSKHISINITPLYAGTELRIAALLSEKGITEEKLNEDPSKLMYQHYNDILKIVALASLNRLAISRLAMWLRIWLLRQASVWQLYELYAAIRQFSGTGPFLIITRLVIQTRMTAPNLGQTAKGS